MYEDKVYKQVGVIVFGKSLNFFYWVNQAIIEGFEILIYKDHIRLYK